MAVNRSEFELIVVNLLKQKPTTRKQQRIGSRKTSATIIPKPAPGSAPQLASDKSEEPSEPSC